MNFRQSLDLTRAVKLKDAKTVRDILQRSPNLLLNDDKMGAKLLNEAVNLDQLEIFKLLVDFNADASSRNPLQVAMKLGDLNFTETLLLDSGPPTQESACFAFARNTLGSRKKKLQLLLKHGLEFDNTFLTSFIQFHVDKDDADAVEVAEVLVSSGASVHQVDTQGYSTLCRAIFSENLVLVSYLINQGSDVNLEGLYPLHQAVRRDNEAMTDLLVTAGADVNTRDDYGWSALHLACYCTHEGIIALLIRRGADVNARTDDGVTPLSLLENTWKYYGGLFGVIVREFARLSFEGLDVSGRDMEVVMANPGTRAHFRECRNELKEMKSAVFYGGQSYFAVMKMSRKRLVRMTRNREFVERFQGGLNRFVHYQEDLTRIFNEATRIRDGLIVVEQRLKAVFWDYLPDVVIRKLREHLRIDDLPV